MDGIVDRVADLLLGVDWIVRIVLVGAIGWAFRKMRSEWHEERESYRRLQLRVKALAHERGLYLKGEPHWPGGKEPE